MWENAKLYFLPEPKVFLSSTLASCPDLVTTDKYGSLEQYRKASSHYLSVRAAKYQQQHVWTRNVSLDGFRAVRIWRRLGAMTGSKVRGEQKPQILCVALRNGNMNTAKGKAVPVRSQLNSAPWRRMGGEYLAPCKEGNKYTPLTGHGGPQEWEMSRIP
jgi:hypothetical protein